MPDLSANFAKIIQPERMEHCVCYTALSQDLSRQEIFLNEYLAPFNLQDFSCTLGSESPAFANPSDFLGVCFQGHPFFLQVYGAVEESKCPSPEKCNVSDSWQGCAHS